MNGAGGVVLATRRTTLSEISIADAPFFYELVHTPGWLKYIGDRKLASLAATKAYLHNGLLQLRAQHGYGYYLVRDARGTSIGVAGFLKRDYLEHEDFGFAFMPEFNNRGYAREACTALLAYAVPRFGFKILDAVTMQANKPARGLLEKLAFCKIGNISVSDNSEDWLLYQYRLKHA